MYLNHESQKETCISTNLKPCKYTQSFAINHRNFKVPTNKFLANYLVDPSQVISDNPLDAEIHQLFCQAHLSPSQLHELSVHPEIYIIYIVTTTHIQQGMSRNP